MNVLHVSVSPQVQDSMQVPFKKQMRVEVVDKTHLCRTRVALVEQVRLTACTCSLNSFVCVYVCVFMCLCVCVSAAGDRRASPSGVRGV